MKRALLATLVAIAAASCKSPEPSAPTPDPTPEATAEPEAAATNAIPCELTTSSALIESVRLESADGACKVYLPSPVRVGEFEVRVSASGDVAAVEAPGEEGTLYATSGTLTVTAVAEGRVQGTLTAEDDAPPATGQLTTTFDVALP